MATNGVVLLRRGKCGNEWMTANSSLIKHFPERCCQCPNPNLRREIGSMVRGNALLYGHSTQKKIPFNFFARSGLGRGRGGQLLKILRIVLNGWNGQMLSKWICAPFDSVYHNSHRVQMGLLSAIIRYYFKFSSLEKFVWIAKWNPAVNIECTSHCSRCDTKM